MNPLSLIPKGYNAVKIRVDMLDFPLIKHVGVLVKEGKKPIVYHLVHNRINRQGGGVIREDFEDFRQGRYILKVTPKKVNKRAFKKYLKANQDKKYKLLTKNCEHFANGLVGDVEASPQLYKWLGISGIAVLIGVGFFNKNASNEAT